MPKLMNDFTHLLQVDDKLPQTRAVFMRFQVSTYLGLQLLS
jgi:hypothetical protein